ncbi:hypothetical protein R3X27_01370 [Tropicimonas sp. TH_r6]|uniref:hypothetical protein n=1 Tax=Tropicimonas sp. TH_r6 TaxID=3082085 RepID=UPI00295319D3|nr:hypothetical protein [Tropicimonas sp. TH_r6]MDV7141323.1 hypothetical protein [Tropicimonas sp. TH_r6]
MIRDLLEKFSWQMADTPPNGRGGSSDLIAIPLNNTLAAVIDTASRRVYLESDAALPKQTLEHYILDIVLPHLLSHDGHLVLHGGFVKSDAGGIGFIGPSGAGKSTLTASFLDDGATLLSDDTLMLHHDADGVTVEALYPSLRLFPDSLSSVLPQSGETRTVAHYFDKRRLSFARTAERSPADVLFYLDVAQDAEGEISLRRLEPRAACMAVLKNCFTLDVESREELANRFRRASEVANALPVYALVYPREYSRLAEIRAQVLSLVAEIKTQ